MRTEGSVDIEAPVDDVFRWTTNHVADWSNLVVLDEVIEQHPEGVGTRFRTVTSENGRRMEFDGVVTRHEPPAMQTVVLTGQMFDLEVQYDFQDLGNVTRVTQRSTVTGKGLMRFILPLSGWLMKKSSCDALRKELDSLKRFCELRVQSA